MPRPSIDQIRSLGDFLSVYRWDLSFAKTPSGLGVSSDDINLRCLSSDLPKVTGTSIEINIRGHKVKQPGIYNYSNTITITLVETVDAKIHNFLKNWREMCWETKTGKQKKKADLEADIILQLLDSEDNPVWQYKLIGCYLEDYDWGSQLTGDTSDVFRPTITLSYDYFEDEAVGG